MASPLIFEQNRGQFSPDLHYAVRSPGLAYGFRPGGVLISTHDDSVELNFVSAKPGHLIRGEDQRLGKVNYFKGNDPARWQTDVATYSKLRYESIYEGIDALFYEKPGRGLEYDLIVAPGADPGQFGISVGGDGGLEIDPSGDLVIRTPEGTELALERPYAYQLDSTGAREVVEAGYEVRGEVVGIELGGYDRARELVIDPVIVYSTVFEPVNFGANARYGDMAVDLAGNAYVAGWTGEPAMPIVGGFDSVMDDWDAFVVKFNADGSDVIYSTYLGGTDEDRANGIEVDATGAAYVVGGTNSADFPTTPDAYDTTLSDTGQVYVPSDVFVTKIAPDGTSITYSTYMGGSDGDGATSVALGPSGDIHLSGRTNSIDLPVLNAFQPYCNFPGDDETGCASTGDGFVATFSSVGDLRFSSFIGGNGPDAAEALTSDGTNKIFATGDTFSTNFPVVGGFQSTKVGSASDAFVTKIDPDAGAIVYSSYLGGSGEERGYGIALDPLGSAVISGFTVSPNFPTTPGAFQGTYASPYDVFVTKVAPDGASLIYSSHLGGSGQELNAGFVAVNAAGEAFVAGHTRSADFPSPNPPGCDGLWNDAFITRVNNWGNGIIYSTCHGGSLDEIVMDVALDITGNAYVAGITNSFGDFPTTPGAYDTNLDFGGIFVVKFDLSSPPAISGTTTNSMWASISAYNAITGTLASYQCCNTSESWSVPIQPSSCAEGGGYKVLMTPQEGFQSRWYNDKPNWSEADCVDSPQSGVDSVLPASNLITGYVKDGPTAADINGAYLYFFNSAGSFVGWTKSGIAGPGRYEKYLQASESYKVLVKGPATHEDIWYSSAMGYAEASAVTTPATANFSLRPAATISGSVFQLGSLLPGAYVSAYPSCGCTSPKNAISGPSGTYSIKVPTTASSGYQYRIRAIPPSGQTRWYSDALSIAVADDVSAPTSNINIETPP